MSEMKLTVKARAKAKASLLSSIRNNSGVPGAVYGLKKESVLFSADYNTVVKVMNTAGTSQVIDLDLDGQTIPVIVRDFQKDPVSDKLIHVDFLAVDEKETFTTIVPLKFTGTSKAVREQGGKLEIKRQSVKVRCLPKDLPAFIEVNLSELADIGNDIIVEHLSVSKEVKILDNPFDKVVDVVVPRKEVIAPTAVAEIAPAEGEKVATPAAAPAEKK
jgi:large subunit ribosomal protein L25